MRVHFVFLFHFILWRTRLSDWKKNRSQVKGKHLQIARAYAGVCRKDSECNEIYCHEVIACMLKFVVQAQCECRSRQRRCIFQIDFHRLHAAATSKGLGH